MKFIIIHLIKFYQFFISPLLGNNCRFSPTCSQYTKECFEVYSPIKAFCLSLVRICKCHPFHSGGYDPVQKEHSKK